MFKVALHNFAERARCAKHNWFDGMSFTVHYSGGVYRVDTADGLELRFRHNPYLAFFEITKGYLHDEEWSLEPGACVVDAGACRGEFALYASMRVGPTGRVFVLEPDPPNMDLVRETFNLNGGEPQNVTLLEEGLWKESGELSFAAGNCGTSAIELEPCPHDPGHRRPSTKVRVTSLTEIIANHGVRHLDFVKMDIEGAEIEAVEAALPLRGEKRVRRFSIASYHRRDGRPTSEMLERMFRTAGYDVTTGCPRHPTTYASIEGRS